MVQEAAEAQHDGYRAAVIDTKPPDYDALEQVYQDWTSGFQLQGVLTQTRDLRQGTIQLAFLDWQTCIYQAQQWSEDGLECTLGITCQDGTYSTYDNETGELLSQEPRERSGIILYRMRYDPRSGHWKMNDFLEILNAPGQ